MNIWQLLSIMAQILAYIFGVIIIVQIIRIIAGGSWAIEDAILALVILTLTLCFGIIGYLININNRISGMERMIHGHVQWHKGKDNRKN